MLPESAVVAAEAKAGVSFTGKSEIVSAAAAYRLGNFTLSEREMIAISGALDGSIIRVNNDDGILWLSIDNDVYAETANRMLQLNNDDGERVLLILNNINQGVKLEHQGKGVGALSLKQAASASGVSKITVFAAGSKYGAYNGYYTWARLGFNAHLPKDIASKLPPELFGAKDLHELMATEDGRKWWFDNGRSLELSFDLQKDSQSIQNTR